jgi:NitT/TauT family transport system ATP-binding protein
MAYSMSGNAHTEVMKDLSFCVAAGEFVSLIGPTGCGKSTILRMAAGLQFPSAGQVLFEGSLVTGPGPERGLVFQSYNAFPWLTVRQNVAFGLNGGQARNSSPAVTEWLTRLGLSDFADAYPKQLSGGMRQRLALARTMIVRPKLVLLDEPFGALDEHTRENMQQVLLAIARDESCTVLLVTHDVREAVLLSDRTILFSRRPARILDIADCPIPRPRTRECLSTPEFHGVYSRLMNAFPAAN